jgi:vancomycin resistance protein YoaR
MTNLEIPKKSFKPKNKILLVLIIIISLLFAMSSIYSISTLAYNKSYDGISVNNEKVGKMSRSDLQSILTSKFSDKAKNLKVTLKYKNKEKEISFTEIDVKYDIDKAIDDIMSLGRQGNIFHRLMEVSSLKKSGKLIEMAYSYNTDTLKTIIENFNSETIKYVKEVDLVIEDSKVTMHIGHPGESIDTEAIYKAIDESIKSCTDLEFDVPTIITPPNSINVDEIYNKITTEPIDAKAKFDENNNISIVPHTNGRSIDKAELVSIINEIEKKYDTQKVLPVKFIEPKVTTSIFSANLFKDTIGTASTNFNTNSVNNANRAVNMRLSVSKINGKILLPGDVFSFNDVVGPRTADRGYKSANSYIGGKIVQDIGGGICQVSTTLYNSTLKSDLETVFRSNHMFTVGYVPFGQDAAVSYDSTDFKFKNNTNMPIKILGSVTSSNQVVFSILGTNETPNKTIEISNVQIGSTPAPVRYVNDPTLPEGQTVVVNSGMAGYVIDTYKIVKINGEVQSKTKIHRSTYRTLERVVKRGTKSVPVSDASLTTAPQDLYPASNGMPDSSSEGVVDPQPFNDEDAV